MKKRYLLLTITIVALNITAFAQQTTPTPENQNNTTPPELCQSIKDQICTNHDTYFENKEVKKICEKFNAAINSNKLPTSQYCEQQKETLCPRVNAFVNEKLREAKVNNKLKEAFMKYKNANLCATKTYGGR